MNKSYWSVAILVIFFAVLWVTPRIGNDLSAFLNGLTATKVHYEVKPPPVSERLSDEDMFYACREAAVRVITETVSRTINVPHDNSGLYYQYIQTVDSSMGALHNCEVLRGAYLTNMENELKIAPDY